MQMLSVFPDGFAFFQEGSDAFLEVRSATDAGVFEDGAFKVGVNASLFGGDEETLGAAEAAGADFDEIVGEFAGTRHQFIGLDNFADKAELLCFFRRNFAASEKEVAGALIADLPRQKDRNDCGKKSDAHFGVAETSLGHRESEIAKSGNTATAGQRETVHGSDHGAGKAPDAAKEFGHPA